MSALHQGKKPHVVVAFTLAERLTELVKMFYRNPGEERCCAHNFPSSPLCFGEGGKTVRGKDAQAVAASRSLRSCCLRKPERSRVPFAFYAARRIQGWGVK